MKFVRCCRIRYLCRRDLELRNAAFLAAIPVVEAEKMKSHRIFSHLADATFAAVWLELAELAKRFFCRAFCGCQFEAAASADFEAFELELGQIESLKF
jgi:hypothetical protein